jgi:hypothetical protein
VAPEEPVTIAGPSEVKLIGVLTGEGRDPRFSFELTFADGTEERATVAIGDPVYGAWSLIEYNPALRTVTLSDTQRIVVVRTGEAVPLSP